MLVVCRNLHPAHGGLSIPRTPRLLAFLATAEFIKFFIIRIPLFLLIRLSVEEASHRALVLMSPAQSLLSLLNPLPFCSSAHFLLFQHPLTGRKWLRFPTLAAPRVL